MSLRLLAAYSGTIISTPIILYEPFWGIPITILLYFFRGAIWHAPQWFRPVWLFTAITTFSWIFNGLRGKCKLNMTTTGLFFLILIGLFYVSSFQAVKSTNTSLVYTMRILKIVIFMILMINLIDTLPKLKITLYTIMFGIGNLVYNSIVIFMHTGSRRIENLGGQGGGSEFFTYLLTMTLPFLYYGIIGNNKFEKYLSIVVLPFWCFGLFITETRAGLIALFVLGLLLLIKSKAKFKFLLLGSIAVVLFVVSAPPTYWERMSTIKQGKDASRVRIDLWTLAFDLFEEHSLLGVGPDNFRDISLERTSYRAKEARDKWGIEVGQEAHNIFLQLLAEGGIISFSIYITIILICLTKLRKIRLTANSHDPDTYTINLSHSLELSIIIFFVNSMFISSLHHDVSYWFFAMSESLSNICNKNIDELKEKETSSH